MKKNIFLTIVLALLDFVFLVFILAPIIISIGKREPLPPTKIYLNPTPTASVIRPEQYIVTLVNEERVKEGLKPVFEIKNLDEGAIQHAKDLVGKKQWSHDGYAQALYKSLLYPTGALIGECLAQYYQTENQVFVAWMNSPTHKHVIMNSRYSFIGVGYYEYHWVLWMSNTP